MRMRIPLGVCYWKEGIFKVDIGGSGRWKLNRLGLCVEVVGRKYGSRGISTRLNIIL